MSSQLSWVNALSSENLRLISAGGDNLQNTPSGPEGLSTTSRSLGLFQNLAIEIGYSYPLLKHCRILITAHSSLG